MSSVEAHLNKLREERIAREKARIEKLREINLKRYSKNEPQPAPKNFTQVKSSRSDVSSSRVSNQVKNFMHINGASKRSEKTDFTKTVSSNKELTSKPKITEKLKIETKIPNDVKKVEKTDSKLVKKVLTNPKIEKKPSSLIIDRKPVNGIIKKTSQSEKSKIEPKFVRKSIVPQSKSAMVLKPETRKSMIPLKPTISVKGTTGESVFDRLYKPKIVPKKEVDSITKLHTDPNYLKKVIKDSGLILNKRHTVFDTKPKLKVQAPVRRSISAVHFKRINKNELSNCIHKWSSIGEKINEVHLADINEDEKVKEDKIVSAVRSERKKVKFQTPVLYNFNTPRPEELQSRLQNWLKSRGKSVEQFHHLQCFGLHHMTQKPVKPLTFEPEFDEENKENIALDSDSDDDSYTENMNDDKEPIAVKDSFGADKWRRASVASSCVADLNETHNDSSLTSVETMHHVDELLVGALTDLTELLREGFDWEHCARWLRAIRERFPNAPQSAQYWECRAALEERRGDLPASVHCWEQAIAKGTEHSVVEANLDQLLDKFMQLKISPNSGKRKPIDPKMVDVKNVFKSTIIRFAVQQAKLRQSLTVDPPKFTITPVRRSGRLSARFSGRRSPLRIVTTIKQAAEIACDKPTFVPNPTLCHTP